MLMSNNNPHVLTVFTKIVLTNNLFEDNPHSIKFLALLIYQLTPKIPYFYRVVLILITCVNTN